MQIPQGFIHLDLLPSTSSITSMAVLEYDGGGERVIRGLCPICRLLVL